MRMTSKRCLFFPVWGCLWLVAGTGPLDAQLLPGAVHVWDAALDTDGDRVWEDTGTLAPHDWSLLGGVARVPASSATTIAYAYDFDGVDGAAGADEENRSGNHDTTFEVWFRPDGLPSEPRVIFEHGNAPRGLTFGLQGSQLTFLFAAGAASSGVLTFDLDLDGNGIDNTDFIQVVGVVDDTRDQMRLYVDGGHEQVLGIGADSDFTSNDPLGLAANQGRGGGGQNASPVTWSGYYDGQIAIIREYRAAWGLDEVAQNYRAVVPEPQAWSLMLGIPCLLGRRRANEGGHRTTRR